jgi:Fe-S oxidoreductase
MKSREIFWGFSTWMEVLWYVLAAISIVVFFYGLARGLARFSAGTGGALPPKREWPGRFRRAVRATATHVKIAKRKAVVGWSHGAMFYGFTTLFVGTVILAIQVDITEPIFGWRFLQGDFYLGYSVVLDVLGFALIVGLAIMGVRRYIVGPRALDLTRPDRAPDDPAQRRTMLRRGDLVLLASLVALVLTGYLLEGARIAMDAPGFGEFQPVGWLFGEALLLLGASHGLLEVVRMGTWWLHGLLALTFVAAIPFSKAGHMIWSFASLVFTDGRAGARLPAPVSSTEPVGYATLADFSEPHLLELEACTRCGRCHEVCPATATGLPLSPRDVILELNGQLDAAASAAGPGGVIGALWRGSDGITSELGSPVVGDDGVRVETLWSCFQCNACVAVCPVGIEQAPIINQLRRHLVEEDELQPDLKQVLKAIHRRGNSFGESPRKRGNWTSELDFEIVDARSEPVEVLWFVGDYASYDPRNQQISRSLAALLTEAGVSFGLLFEGEQNAGNDIRRIGEEGLFEHLATTNIEALSECRFDRIVTTDPHSFNTLANEYPQFGAAWDVVHHTVLLAELLAEGTLEVRRSLERVVTYHDPCYLGRMNGGYDAPRAIIDRVGCELIEMPRNRENSFCCGAGGGRIWMSDPSAEGPRPSELRIQEALGLERADLFVVCCPKDVTMYEDAIKTTGSSGRLELKEVTELVRAATASNPP